MKITKNKNFVLFFLIVILFISGIHAANWYRGTMHVHTGFSTHKGYPGQANSGCSKLLEGVPGSTTEGYTVTELAEESRDKGVYWNSYTDHSYCIDNSDFNDVKHTIYDNVTIEIVESVG